MCMGQPLSAETHTEQVQHRLPLSDSSSRSWPRSFAFPGVNKNVLFSLFQITITTPWFCSLRFPCSDVNKVSLVYWSPNPQCDTLGHRVFKEVIKLNEANRVLRCVMTGVFMRRGRDTRTVRGLASPLQHVSPEERPCEGKLPWGTIWSQVDRYPPCLWSDPLAWRTGKHKLLLSTQKGRERNSATPSSGTQKATVLILWVRTHHNVADNIEDHVADDVADDVAASSPPLPHLMSRLSKA